MADKVNQSPNLARVRDPAVQALVKSLFVILSRHAYRLNLAIPHDGTESLEGPLQLLSTTVAELSSTWPAVSHPHGAVFVSDETGGPTIAFSDGTNWRRVQDLAIVS